MTLSTHVYLLTEADPHDVFYECRRLLSATGAHPWFDEDGGKWREPGERILRNQSGVGLDALLYLHYRAGESLQPTHEGHDEDCSPDCSGTWHAPAHYLYVDFDTAYSYTDALGGCGALHARLLFGLGGWLDERGIRWAWRNEFSGEIHMGDKYEHLVDLCEGGQSALRWFKGTVEPVIAAMGAR